MTPFDVKVAIGLHDICHADKTSTIFSVSALILHPEFVVKSRQNDLALVRLSESVPFGELVAPICLPSSGSRRFSCVSKKLHAFSTILKSNVCGSLAADTYEHKVSVVATWIKEGEKKIAQNVSRTSCFPRKVGLPILDVSTCSESAPKTQGCLGVVGAPSVLCAVRRQ